MIEKYDNYTVYLNKWLKSQPREGFGIQRKMADFLEVKTSYISQVLSDTVTLKEDHALKLNEFLGHEPMEADYFMLLISIARAGSYQLKNYYRAKAEILRSQLRAAINKDRNVIVPSAPGGDMDLDAYYSSWHYAAVHVLSATQDLTAEMVAARFALPIAAAKNILEYLESQGLLVRKGLKFAHSKKGIHVPKDHRWVIKHHANWRAKLADGLAFQEKDDLHYTSVATMGHSEMLMVKEIMTNVIRDIRGVIEKAKDENVYCYSMDLFRI